MDLKRSQAGFTLLEVMVVVVILGILAALVVPKIMSRPDQARVVAARQDIASLMQALKLYRLDNQRYPTTEQGLQALVARPASAPSSITSTVTCMRGTIGEARAARCRENFRI